ncbi:class III extradiol dioxygenase subunit beta [Streptomyces turgidiscabies]|uniref:Catalytic LigB subunit of aromatic ring-opening dioxygenase n=1 Tax=Streptomyces turgidiscabies (strain Car8) TaxID=698760 RepID=L7EVB0_STRT8|nr:MULTISPECIES: class III extradiol dioxygenase subunit beta [Streptomyces]ELP62606.1 catalytic LigB subunit of aromatic ring-opening dioxygenase [Streptomyces turgidiscabies Car8]MDX3499700.1 class III extradiol dioxygenase subunit beta [Streptomyces turgidiscabies]
MIWGLATSHVPSIGAAMDHGKTQEPYWRPLFDGYGPAREWMAEHRPDIAVIVYNDHANAVDLDLIPAFGIGTAESYDVADEGWGRRPVPPVVGAPELSEHLVTELMDESFDIATFHRLNVDHGLTVPLSVYCPDPGEAWPCAVVPVLVNVIQYPQPTAARCYALGQALGRAIRSFPQDVKVAVFGTGGMSHQLAGARAGLINEEFDRMFLQAIESEPEKLAALTREEYVREAGTEGIELIMWLIMRGALSENIARVHETYHVPASNTAAALALFEDLGAK